MAGVVGFEPAHKGVKVLCLTAWRYPKMPIYYNTNIAQLSREKVYFYILICVALQQNVRLKKEKTIGLFPSQAKSRAVLIERPAVYFKVYRTVKLANRHPCVAT